MLSLVDQHDLGLLDEGPGHGEHLLLAARQGAGRDPPPLLEGREDVEHVAGDGSVRSARDAEVLLHRQRGEEAAVVGDEHHAGAVGGRGTAAPFGCRRRRRCRRGAGSRPASVSSSVVLPAPLGPSRHEHLAGLDVEIEIAEAR